MRILDILLADLLRRGQITVEIPGLDMDRLEKIAHSRTAELLKKVIWVVFDDEAELSDSQKIRELQKILEEEL